MGATKKQYVKALLELLETEADTTKVIKHLKEVMIKRGHDRLLVPVLREVTRILAASTRGDEATLTLADKTDEKHYHKEISKLIGDGQFRTKLDPTIVGGFILDQNNQRLDKSYKSRLISWYRSATKQN